MNSRSNKRSNGRKSASSMQARILRGSKYGASLSRAAVQFARKHHSEFERETGLHFGHA